MQEAEDWVAKKQRDIAAHYVSLQRVCTSTSGVCSAAQDETGGATSESRGGATKETFSVIMSQSELVEQLTLLLLSQDDERKLRKMRRVGISDREVKLLHVSLKGKLVSTATGGKRTSLAAEANRRSSARKSFKGRAGNEEAGGPADDVTPRTQVLNQMEGLRPPVVGPMEKRWAHFILWFTTCRSYEETRSLQCQVRWPPWALFPYSLG